MVLRGTTSYNKWYYESLRGTMSGARRYYEVLRVASHYEVLREVQGTTSSLLEAFSQKLSFKKIVMKNFIKFTGNQL